MDDVDGNFDPPAREPAFNAPWPAVALLAALVLAFGLQFYVLPEAMWEPFALSPVDLRVGRYAPLVGYMFLHSGWGHFLMNASSALAFGPPVARFLGVRGRGPALFFGFFLICGIASGLGFCLLHWTSMATVVGASGAISGLWGAASRLLGQHGGLAPIGDRRVLQMAAVFTGINVLVGVTGALSSMSIAWEAHLIGYAVGLVLIGPLSHLANSGLDRAVRSRGLDLRQP